MILPEHCPKCGRVPITRRADGSCYFDATCIKAERETLALLAEEEKDAEAALGAIRFLLTRIGSWTSARWDQHLRHEFGDEKAARAIRYIDALYQVKAWGESLSTDNKGAGQDAPRTSEAPVTRVKAEDFAGFEVGESETYEVPGAFAGTATVTSIGLMRGDAHVEGNVSADGSKSLLQGHGPRGADAGRHDARANEAVPLRQDEGDAAQADPALPRGRREEGEGRVGRDSAEAPVQTCPVTGDPVDNGTTWHCPDCEDMSREDHPQPEMRGERRVDAPSSSDGKGKP